MDSGDILHCLTEPRVPAPAEGMLATGSVTADILLGGGWPCGEISQLYGNPDHAAAIVAYRTIGMLHHADLHATAVLCTAGYPDIRLALDCRIDKDRLAVTRNLAIALEESARPQVRLIVIDDFDHDAFLSRASPSATVLLLARRLESVRSGACIALSRPGSWGQWVQAERVLHSRPVPCCVASVRICLSRAPLAQEILDAAVMLDVVRIRGRWYRYGTRLLGGCWADAAAQVSRDRRLRRELLGEITRRAQMHPGALHIYRDLP